MKVGVPTEVKSDEYRVAITPAAVRELTQRDHEVTDRGVQPDSGIVDYPPLCADVGTRVVSGHADFGVILGAPSPNHMP